MDHNQQKPPHHKASLWVGQNGPSETYKERREIDTQQGNTNQFFQFAIVGSHPVLHCNLSPLYHFPQARGAGSSYSGVPACLEQLENKIGVGG